MNAFSTVSHLAVVVLALTPRSYGFQHSTRPSSQSWKPLGATLSTISSVDKSNEFFVTAVEEHDSELQEGRIAFGHSTSSNFGRKWTDDDFISRSVGVGNAGPDEFEVQNGDKVFQTRQSVVSAEACNALIDEARQAITDGLKLGKKDNTGDPSNSELGEARVSNLPKAREWLQTTMQEQLMPLLESRFGCLAESLTLQDALIIGYGYFGAPTISQPLHRDSCILSLNVALSPSTGYVGGGTYFQGLQPGGDTIANEQGHVICHNSGAIHAGRKIDSGERWVLVLFVLSDDIPQLARRCHARALQAKRQGNMEEATKAMDLALSLAPNDHQYHTDLGGIIAAQGDMLRARSRLAAAHFGYLPCYKAGQSLGTMLLEQQNRPRAALRWLEQSLDRIGDSDLKGNAWIPLRAAAWDLRVKAAKAAIMCASKSPARLGPTFLPKAMDWIETCLGAAPDHPMLHGMMMTAKRIQSELPNQ